MRVVCDMNKLIFIATMVLAIMFCSCSGVDDRERILGSVPSSAGGVAVVDVANILADSGMNGEGRDSVGGMLSCFTHGGVDAGVVVAFVEKGKFTIVFLLDDVRKFERYYAGRRSVSFSDSDGFRCASDGKVIVKDGMGWWSASGMDLADVRRYLSLADKVSVLEAPYAASLTSDSGAIHCVSRLSSLGAFAGDASLSFKVKGIMSVLFDDAVYVASDVRFAPGKVEASARVLDGKGEAAKAVLPLQRLESGPLAESGLCGEMFVAISPGASVMRRLAERFGGVAGVPERAMDALGELDGLMAVSLSVNDTYPRYPACDFIATFSNAETASSAGDFISAFTDEEGTVSADGRVLHISVGKPDGMAFQEVSERFEGAVAGVYMSQKAMSLVYPPAWPGIFREAVVRIMPEGKSLGVSLELAVIPGQNAAVSLLEALDYGSDK